jgi:hypothetical protein
MLPVEAVEQLPEEPPAMALLDLLADGGVDLRREALALGFERLHHIRVQRHRDLALGQGHTKSLPE